MIQKKGLIVSILIILLIVPQKAIGQNKDLIQYTGRVFNEFLKPLPYAHILIVNKKLGAISDKDGKFSFVVQPNDTIAFSSLGYKHAVVIIPDTLNSKFFTRDVLLSADTFLIEEVEVYPWNTYEEFTEAFLNLELPEDDMDRARQNIAIIKEQLMHISEATPGANYRQTMQQNTWDAYNRGTYPTYQIFNLFAWQKFFKALKNGDFKNNDN